MSDQHICCGRVSVLIVLQYRRAREPALAILEWVAVVQFKEAKFLEGQFVKAGQRTNFARFELLGQEVEAFHRVNL